MNTRKILTLCGSAVFCSLCLTSCSHLGPKTIQADRFDYSTAIADSWKKQTLLNIVKLRYMDLPVFMDVASIVSGYSLESSLSAGQSWPATHVMGGNTFSLGGSVRFTDRPTLTYVPMTGEKFLRGMMTPIAPKNIFFMLQAGYSADFILGLTVESLNGVRNQSASADVMREADPSFGLALELLRQVQAAGAVGMRVEEDKDKKQTAVLFFRNDDMPPEIVEKSAEIRRLLKLQPDQNRLVLTYSPMRGAGNELAVNSRSLLQIMGAFSSYIDVPEAHIKDLSAIPSVEKGPTDSKKANVKIYSGLMPPMDAYTSVFYRGHWFWINNDDWRTKRALMAVMFFFTLADTGSSDKLPLITIPAQ